MGNNNWTPNHPTTPGNYWFYGWTSWFYKDSFNLEPWLMWVKVKERGNSLIYVAESEFLYPDEYPPVGLWKEFELPEIPPDFNERFDYTPEKLP